MITSRSRVRSRRSISARRSMFSTRQSSQAQPVKQKQDADQAEIAKLVAKGTPVAKLNSGIDGGMNQVFAAQVPGASTGLSEGGEGQGLSLAAYSRVPGTIPSTVNPPRAPVTDDTPVAAAPPAAPAPAAAAPTTHVASAAPAAQSDGFFSNLARKIGIGGSADSTASTPAPAAAKPKAADSKAPAAKAATTKPAETKPAETKQAANRPPFKPQPQPQSQAASSDAPPAETAAAPKPTGSLVAGAQPIMPANSFDSRFSAK